METQSPYYILRICQYFLKEPIKLFYQQTNGVDALLDDEFHRKPHLQSSMLSHSSLIIRMLYKKMYS